MPFKITAFYAGINGLILLVLAMRVARRRGVSKVGLGTGGDPVLERAVRIHGNAAESIPIVLILLGLAEACGSKPWLLHGIGIALTLGRLLHVWGLTQSSGASPGRVSGMILTWLALAVGAIRALTYGFSQF